MTLPTQRRFVVARADEVPSGGSLIVELEGHSIGIFSLDGQYYALLNRCPHAGGPLCGGRISYGLASSGPGDVRVDFKQKLIMCPWHGWEFDLETGKSYCDPNKVRVRPYPIEVHAGADIAGRLIEGPYTATTFPIQREDEYLVLTLGR